MKHLFPLLIVLLLVSTSFVGMSIISTSTTIEKHSIICMSNNPPYIPFNPSPANGSIGINIIMDLSWTGGDPDPEDTVTYDVYLGEKSPPSQVKWNQSETTYNPGTLLKGVIYYWMVIAWDNHGAFAEGPIWHFTTVDHHPPYLEIGNITGGFIISAVVKNMGCGVAIDVEWNIRFKGGLILFPWDRCIEGVITSIEPVCKTIVHSRLVLGIGITEINVSANAPNGNTATRSAKSFVFGPFVFIKDN